jgi:radical SAM superfamily enzyme YgiQ (UPF0313 family)
MQWHQTSSLVIDTAELIKKNLPEIKLILGGYTASHFAYEIIEKFDFVDGIIRGDGEVPLLKFAEAVRLNKQTFQDVPNLIWRNGNRIVENRERYVASEKDLNELKYTNFDVVKNKDRYFKLKEMSEKGKFGERPQSFYLSMGRGCSVNCSYCAGCCANHEKLFGRNCPVMRSKESIMEEIRDIAREGFMNISINNFPKLKKEEYYLDILDSIAKEGIRSSVFIEPWYLPSKDVIAKMGALNNPKVYITVDSGSEKVRKINRGHHFKNQELGEVLNHCRKSGVQPILFFTTGLPFESFEDLRKTMDMQKSIKLKYPWTLIATQLIQMEPGAPWNTNPEKWGVKTTLKNFDDFYKFSKSRNTGVGYCTSYFSEEDIMRNSKMLMCEKNNDSTSK